jgi:hypothetical protein
MHSNPRLVGGLGLYPTDKCYDTNRPSWLPYWLSSYTEEDCVINGWFGPLAPYPGVDYTATPALPAPPTVGVPAIGTNPSATGGSNVTPEQAQAIQDKLIADESDSWKAQAQKFFTDLAAKTDGCSWYQTKGADGACTTGSTLLWVAVIGGAAAALFYMKK